MMNNAMVRRFTNCLNVCRKHLFETKVVV